MRVRLRIHCLCTLTSFYASGATVEVLLWPPCFCSFLDPVFGACFCSFLDPVLAAECLVSVRLELLNFLTPVCVD